MLSSVKTNMPRPSRLPQLLLPAPRPPRRRAGEASGATGGVRYVTSTTAQLLGSVTAYGHPSDFKFRY